MIVEVFAYCLVEYARLCSPDDGSSTVSDSRLCLIESRYGACSDADFPCRLVHHHVPSGLRQWIQVRVRSQTDCKDFVPPAFSQLGQYICEADAQNFDEPDEASPWFLGFQPSLDGKQISHEWMNFHRKIKSYLKSKRVQNLIAKLRYSKETSLCHLLPKIARSVSPQEA